MFKILFPILFLITLCGFLASNFQPIFITHPDEKKGVSPRLAADYIQAVIEADRAVYSKYIVDRLGKTISLKATENWEHDDTLILPAQFLLISSQISQQLQGGGMRYRLLSLWPINKNNSARSELEKVGLREVIKNPKEPFTWIIKSGASWYFQAIYPDRAITPSCVSCHNNHPRSPKKDFKMGDVMGGIFINLPLGKHVKTPDSEEQLLAPEVVAGYVHSVLKSDRHVYAKYIVDRFQNKNILKATEHWRRENSLLLPAQFLINASQMVKKRRLGLNFRLISLWPINPQNGPANEFERVGLESVAMFPFRPYMGQIKKGGKRYFQAIYPDFAVAQGCVSCHNAHPKSSKRDFQLNDVIGGIVVTLVHN